MCIFENDQWLVDGTGIRSKPPAPTYEIATSRLLEDNRTKTSYDLPVDMAEKSWVNVDMFTEAYRAALGRQHRSLVSMLPRYSVQRFALLSRLSILSKLSYDKVDEFQHIIG